MNKHMFFYTRIEQINGPDGEKTIKEYRDGINTSKIIRAVLMSDNDLLILLDDIHQRVEEKPNINLKTNKVVGMKKELGTFQSEIHITEQHDIDAFYKLTDINNE